MLALVICHLAVAQAAPVPYYTPELLHPGDLAGHGLRELSLMRNTIFARAGNRFDKKWLADYFHRQPWYHQRDHLDLSVITLNDRKNASLIARYEDSLTKQQLEGLVVEAQARPPSPERDVELRILSVRLGRWLGPKDAQRTPLEDPALLDHEITAAQLADLSRRDLRVLRNTIFARRGRAFESPVLRAYFANEPWYHPDAAYTDSRLTAVDRHNTQVILQVEKSRGGPLVDPKPRAGAALALFGIPLDRQITVAEVRALSREQRWYLRNAIYARRGRPFKTAELTDYFTEAGWYTPRADYSDALLSDLDRRNVQLIQSVERQNGGPFSAEDLREHWSDWTNAA